MRGELRDEGERESERRGRDECESRSLPLPVLVCASRAVGRVREEREVRESERRARGERREKRGKYDEWRKSRKKAPENVFLSARNENEWNSTTVTWRVAQREEMHVGRQPGTVSAGERGEGKWNSIARVREREPR